ncbi:MAG: NAD-dependent epimerase/dehydratase family protein, partial [Myxococcota bacterium]|nr:NAD-dependent epimerase/dehydratase family protein [Myxococcota bacterium]
MKDRRILITGGAGFIGSSLALELIKENEVVIFDNLHRNAMAGTALEGHPKVTFIQGDVLDAQAVE